MHYLQIKQGNTLNIEHGDLQLKLMNLFVVVTKLIQSVKNNSRIKGEFAFSVLWLVSKVS